MSIVTRHSVNKSVSDQLGITKYEAVFITDNETFVKCELLVTGGIPVSFYDDRWKLNFTSFVKCDPEDTFNLFIGNYKALKRCLDKLESSVVRVNFGQTSPGHVINFLAKFMPGKSRWDSLFAHIAHVDMMYLAALERIAKGKDRQLRLPFN